MNATWIASDNIISPLGSTAGENYRALRQKKTGISLHHYDGIKEALHLGKITTENNEERYSSLTRLERLSIQSVEETLAKTTLDPTSTRTVFILSTTKGNIELLEQGKEDHRLYLHESAKTIARFFGNNNPPIVVSNACISGVMALLTGKYLIESGQYDHAVITGADVLSYFVISGFQSLQALSPEVCKPFDKNRKGINLGEAAATLLLSADPLSIGVQKNIRITGGGLTNDANHISGPSRTGEELNSAIQKAMNESGMDNTEIDFISAHGTGTIYNDEMEAKAFHLAGMDQKPLNSLKGYFGHTLGAAGILESVVSIHALNNNELIASLGYDESGVSLQLNVIREVKQQHIRTCLKTASGFGGCNAAMILKKEL